MGRKKNYSTEQLKKLVDEYVRIKADYSALTATEIADFCTSRLHLVPPVTYQTFTRDKEVMEYIGRLNQALHERMLVPSSRGAHVHRNIYLTGDDNDDPSSLLQRANLLLADQHDRYEALQHRYDSCVRELHATRLERDELKSRNAELEKDAGSIKKELSAVRYMLKKEKHLTAVLRRYFEQYIYDPICLRHVAQLGWIADKSDSIKRCSVTADIVQEIQEAYKELNEIMTIPENGKEALPIEEDAENGSPVVEENDIEIIDTESEDFLRKLKEL